jgi:hypothetical protein
VSADSGYTLLLRLEGESKASALLQASFVSRSESPPSLTLHGEDGSLSVIGGVMTSEIKHCRAGSQDWASLEIPSVLTDSFPEDFVQGCWNALFRDFIADIRGEEHEPYPTFYDGWVSAELIDIARGKHGWRDIVDPGAKITA